MRELMENWRRLVLEASEDKPRDVELVLGDEEEEEEEGDEADLEEWKAEDDDEYPSRKKEKREKRMLKQDRTSWVPGADSLAKGGLTKGIVEKKKERKQQCHA